MKKHILYVSTTLPTPGLGSSVIIYRHLKRLKDWKVGYAPNHKKQKEIAEAHTPPIVQLLSLDYLQYNDYYCRRTLPGLSHTARCVA